MAWADASAPRDRDPTRFGDYRILRRVARGGMGIIYEAIQVSLERRVALKTLPPGLVADGTALARFEREAKASGRLHHPNIVEIYASGVEDGVPYYAMEFVDGPTLRDLEGSPRDGDTPATQRMSSGASTAVMALSACWSGAGEWSNDETGGRSASRDGSGARGPSEGRSHHGVPNVPAPGLADYRRIAEGFAAVADGLQHAHSLGVIHRDVKPSNIILHPGSERDGGLRGRLRILDFGLAWIEGQEHLTLTEESVGTPAYMSPEQAQPGSHEVGPATDVYGLGITLYEVLTDSRPFGGRNVHQTLSQIIARDPFPPRALNPHVPRDLETIVLKCIGKSPRERYATAEALAQDLRRFARGDAIEARHYTRWERTARRAWRNRARIAVAAVMTLLVAIGSWLGVAYSSQRQRLLDARYRELLSDAATRIQETFAVGRSRPGASRDGRYSAGVFVPRGMQLSDPGDFAAALRSASFDPLREARIRIGAARRLFPDRPDARFYEARILVRQGRLEAALDVLESLVDRHPGFVPGWALRALLLEKTGDAYGASAAKARAVDATRGRRAEFWLAAQGAMERSQWGAAAEAFSRLGDLGDERGELYVAESLDTLLGRGAALVGLGDHEGAIVEFARAEGRWPSNPEPSLLLGRAELLAGRWREAAADFDRLYRRTDAGARDSIAFRIADAYALVGDTEQSLSWVRRLEDAGLRARCEAPLHVLRGRWDEALRCADEAIRLRPSDALGHQWRGLTLLSGKDDEEAAEGSLVTATRLDPEAPMARVWLGDLLAKRGRLDEALAQYSLVVEMDPHNAWARISRGVTLERQGKHAAALESYLAALELAPTLEAAYQHVDGMLRREDRPDLEPFLDRLSTALERAISSGRDHSLVPEFLRIVALSCAASPRRDRVEMAVAYAGRAVERTKREVPRMLAALARAFAANGQGEAALATLEEAVRLPHATRGDLEALAAARARLLPDVVSCASADAALEAADREEILPEGASWRCFPGRRDPSPEGARWHSPDFDDGSWSIGPSGFGYGDGDDRTCLEDMKGSYTTVFIRTEFDVPDVGDGSRYVLAVRSDDGFVAWLNGVEVARGGISPRKDPLSHDAVADATVSVEPPLPVDVPLASPLLRAGRNVLALQGLNVSLDSSDLSLIPVLRRERAADRERDRAVLEALRAARRDRTLPLAYLEARTMQRAGRLAEATAGFREAVATATSTAARDASRVDALPTLRLVECLRAKGDADEAEACLRRGLEGDLAGERDIWNLWFSTALGELAWTPGEALARLPRARSLPPGVGNRTAGDDLWWILARLSAAEPIRINCGGVEVRDAAGRDWGADRFFLGGCRFGEQPWGSPPSDGVAPAYGGEIGGTDDDAVYQTERWFPAEEIPPAGYRIPLPPASYRVRLHFAEVFFQKDGLRVFDVLVEERPFLTWYSPPVSSPPSPQVRTGDLEVRDGFLDIRFVPQIEHPKISAIEIEAAP